MFKLAIFDFDGTMAETETVIINTMTQTIRHMGLPYRTPQQIRATIGLRLEDAPKVLYPDMEVDGDYFAADYRQEFPNHNLPGIVKLYPGVKEGLKKIHRAGVLIAIGSSRNHSSLDVFVRDLGLQSFVAMVVGGDDVSKGKPDPEMAQLVLEHFHLTPKEVVMVGDMCFDILTARAAGMPTIGVTWGNGTREELKQCKADYIVDHFDQIPPIILA